MDMSKLMQSILAERVGTPMKAKQQMTRALILVLTALVCMVVAVETQTQDSEGARATEIQTSQGAFPLDERGMPKPETIQALFDELDYQSAVQTYLWAFPQMVIAGQHEMAKFYGAKDDLDVLHLYQDAGVLGMLTPNTIVKYVLNYYNFEKMGPMVLEMPGGNLVGLMMDYQCRWVADLGLVSVSGVNPETIVFIGPNQSPPDEALANGWRIERVGTTVGFLAIRVLKPKEDVGLAEKIRIYPWSKRENPPKNPVYQPGPEDETYFIRPPKGMAYWEQLNGIVQQERVQEVDRYFMSHLETLGIKKGKPFAPTERQKRILERAAFVGEKMALVGSFVPRSEQARYRDDTSWVHVLVIHPNHITEHTQQFEERFDFFYEAYGLSPAMKARVVGKGSTYLGAYRDSDGEWLDGDKTYKLTIAPNPPAAQFWAVTVYDMDNRSIILNGDENRTEISTFTEGLKTNPDGSVDLYFGPEAPAGKASNWIKTNRGENWFAYLRLYAPTEGYFDRSWPMHDVEKVK